MTRPRILIVSHLYEPSVNAVVQELERSGIHWARFNTESFPLLSAGGVSISGRKLETSLVINNSEIDIGDVNAVWFRRMSKWILPSNLSGHELEFAENECRAFVQGLFFLLEDATWTNDPDSERRASNKIGQLKTAASLGFSVPKTLITNSPSKVRKFVDENPGELIFKPLSGFSSRGSDFSREFLVAYGSELKHSINIRPEVASVPIVFAKVLTQEHLKNLDAIVFSPTIFQERVPKRLEVRVTVVADEIFAAEIHSQEHEETSVDFRRMNILGTGKIPTHRIHSLPLTVQTMLIEYMRITGLSFACFDLILKPDGEYIFLEVNPNGQWLWIEKFTGLKITQAFAAHLAQPM